MLLSGIGVLLGRRLWCLVGVSVGFGVGLGVGSSASVTISSSLKLDEPFIVSFRYSPRANTVDYENCVFSFNVFTFSVISTSHLP